MKRFLTALLVTAIVTPAGALDVSSLVAKIGDSVVTVGVLKTKGLGSGTGFFVDTKGHLVTCAHVVKDSLHVMVLFRGEANSMSIPARVIAVDEFHDLALLSVDSELIETVPVRIGDSTVLKAGEDVFTIGSPLGMQDSVSTGVIAHPSRGAAHHIQFTASINPGSSGGPVFNRHGELIGVCEGIMTDGGLFNGIAFAIPSDTVKWFLHKYTLGGTR